MGKRSYLQILILLFAVFAASPAPVLAHSISGSDGQKLFETAFNPERYFGFDYAGLRPDGLMGIDELILTVKVSARDDYLPEYALAIAYTCKPDPEKEGNALCNYTARMLRVKPDKNGSTFDNSIEMVKAVKKAKGKLAKRRAFSKAKVEWLESDLTRNCHPAIKAMDELATKADWKPSLHYTRIKMEHRGLILHPAQMWITMNGNEQITRWQGWRNADGAAYGVRLLTEALDKCWKPSKAQRPWKHIK